MSVSSDDFWEVLEQTPVSTWVSVAAGVGLHAILPYQHSYYNWIAFPAVILLWLTGITAARIAWSSSVPGRRAPVHFALLFHMLAPIGVGMVALWEYGPRLEEPALVIGGLVGAAAILRWRGRAKRWLAASTALAAALVPILVLQLGRFSIAVQQDYREHVTGWFRLLEGSLTALLALPVLAVGVMRRAHPDAEASRRRQVFATAEIAIGVVVALVLALTLSSSADGAKNAELTAFGVPHALILGLALLLVAQGLLLWRAEPSGPTISNEGGSP